MSVTVARSDCGQSIGRPHKPDVEAVLFGYKLKAFVLLMTELDKAGILEETGEPPAR